MRGFANIAAASLLLVNFAASPVQAACPTCDVSVVVRGDQIQCLERRLQPYLKTTRDPILVSVLNCGGADDQPRLDAPPKIGVLRPRRGPAADQEKQVYLLSRAYAECLAKALASRPRKLKEFRLELTAC